MLDGIAAGERDVGVVVRLEPDFIRDYGEDEALGTLEVALKYAGRGVVAINSAGRERYPAGRFAHLMKRAIDAGLPSVPHAGEWAGPENGGRRWPRSCRRGSGTACDRSRIPL